MQWYYLDPNKQQVPFDEGHFQAFVAEGRLTAETLVWNESMAEWTAVGQLYPQLFQQAQPQQQSVAQVQRAAAPAAGAATVQARGRRRPGGPGGARTQQVAAQQQQGAVTTQVAGGDEGDLIRHLATFIATNAGWIKFYGVMMIISGIATIPIGGLFIWLGIILLKAADQSRIALSTGTRENLEQAMFSLGRFFKINGIVMLVMIFIYALIIILFVVMGGFAALAAAGAASAASENGQF